MKESLPFGSWEQFFRPVLGVSLCHLWSTGLLCGGVGSTFCRLRFWRGLCVCPSHRRRSGSWPFSFWPCCLSPSLGIGLLRRPRGDSFHLGCFFMRWSSTHGGLASGSSGGLASWFGLLVYVQGTSDSLPRSSSGVRSNLWFLV